VREREKKEKTVQGSEMGSFSPSEIWKQAVMMFFFSFDTCGCLVKEWDGMGACVRAVVLVRLTELLVGALDWIGLDG